MSPVNLSKPLLLAGGMCCGMPAFSDSGFGSGDGPVGASARLGFQVVIPAVLSLRVAPGTGQFLVDAKMAANVKNASLTASAADGAAAISGQGDPQVVYTVASP